jgi:hypothetical protein
MRLPFPLASIYARTAEWSYEALARPQTAPGEAQERAFQRLRARLQGTVVERVSGLSAATDLRSFAATVPVRDYAFFEPLVERVVDQGEPRVLSRSPPVFVGLSSGTTGKAVKRVVHDRHSIAAFKGYEVAVAVLVASQTDVNPLFDNRLSWGTDAALTTTKGGVPQGYISGYMAQNPHPVARRHTFPSAAVSAIADMKKKIQAAAPELRRRSIHLASSVPSYFLSLLEELRDLWGVEDFSRIWPDLSLVVYGGVAIHPYRAQIAKLLGRPVRFLGMYVATEGPLGYEIPALNGGENGLFSFHLADIVFTFRKLDGDGRILTIDDLSPGDRVELLLTTPNGLVQYRIGDCLTIRSTRPLLFEIAGRVGHGLNLAAEKATLSELARAAARVGDASPTTLRHYFVCPGASPRGKPCYAWTLLVDRPAAIDGDATIAALDRAMMELNDSYREGREELALLDAPRLRVLDASVARRYFERDGHRGQLKMKTAFDASEKLDEFLAGLGVDAGALSAE